MLARLARELPIGNSVVYEPKWDGFRCVAARNGDEVDMRSRNNRPLARYFPEVAAALQTVAPPTVALDGELVVSRDGRADFAALMSRLHPAASRVARLAAESPATYVVFDVLHLDGDLLTAPFRERRRRLESLLATAGPPLALTPATADPARAAAWLDAPAWSGIDGVVAKDLDAPYEPGRRAMVKVKAERTADCAVAGLRVFGDEPIVGSLLLGLFDGGVLRHVGVATSFPRPKRVALADELRELVTPLAHHPWRDGFALEGGPMGRLRGAAGRWLPEMGLDWVPLRPDRVAEVTYDQVDGIRFRHPARFKRWRPDRDAASCTIDQLAERA